jgi:hypothetical protein
VGCIEERSNRNAEPDLFGDQKEIESRKEAVFGTESCMLALKASADNHRSSGGSSRPEEKINRTVHQEA